MEKETHFTEPLIQRIEQYRKTSLELVKLKLIDKSSEIAAYVISRTLLISVLSVFVIVATIALALWIGEWMGASYLGFTVVAAFYALLSIILLASRGALKRGINNAIVRKLLN